MTPFIMFGVAIGFFISAITSKGRNQKTVEQIKTVVGTPLDVTSHLAEFSALIRRGHKPNEWLITQAINEAISKGDWNVAQAISDNFCKAEENLPQFPTPPIETPIIPVEAAPVEVPVVSETPNKEEAKVESPKFLVEKTSSPIKGIPDDEWRMFVDISRVEAPEFDSENSFGMFRQNKKRTAKLGLTPSADPVEQYTAFEKEVEQLLQEGQALSKMHVAMPIDVGDESIPLTLSGLVSVMRNAGTKNAESWIDSKETRNKFSHTTEFFKKANGIF